MIKNKKIILLSLVFFMIFNFIPIKSYAHDAYFFQVLIDENTMSYLGNIISDRASRFSYEKKHIEPQLWKAKKFADAAKTNSLGSYDSYEGTDNGKDSMAFTFPSKEIRKPANHVTSKDIDRMFEIRDTLVPNLNEVLTIINDGKKYRTIEDLISASEVIINGGTHVGAEGNSWSISYNDKDIVVKSGNVEYSYLAKMVKGYNRATLEDGRESKVYDSSLDYSDDVVYITIPMIVFQANYTYKIHGHTADHADEYSKPGVLEEKLSELLTSGINGIRSLLGLYSLNELVYNQGVRDPRGFYGGVMHNEWMEKTMTYHMIAQGIAWLILGLAVLKILFQKNLSTLDSHIMSRVNLMNNLKDLLMTGFVLVASFVLLNMLLNLNARIVAIFHTTIPDYAAFSGMGNDYRTFAGSLLQIYYLLITIYMNFVYIIRSITVAILIAAAPFFIVSIAFEGRQKRLFTTWMKELVANIFLQSFHAFTLGFLLNIQMSTRGIELAIVSFALIPLTNLFKSLVVGQNAGLAGQLGMQATTMGLSAVGGLAGGAIGGMMGDSSVASRGRSIGARLGKVTDGSAGDIPTKSRDDIPGARENPERREHSSSKPPNRVSTGDAISSMETNLNSQATRNAEINNYEKLSARSQGFTKEGFRESLQDLDNKRKEIQSVGIKGTATQAGRGIADYVKENKEEIKGVAKSVGSGAVNIAKGTGKVALGATAAMALGGSDPNAGRGLIDSGIDDISLTTRGAVRTVGGKVKDIGLTAMDYFKGNQGGNILGAERMDNGDVVIHRNRKMVNNDGLKDVRKTSEGNVAMTYDRGKLSEANRANLRQIEQQYKDGNLDYLKNRGVEKVNKNNDGNTVVHYNQHGQNNLGFKDIYQTGNRIVETKNSDHPLDTNLIYNLNDIKPTPPRVYERNKRNYKKSNKS